MRILFLPSAVAIGNTLYIYFITILKSSYNCIIVKDNYVHKIKKALNTNQ